MSTFLLPPPFLGRRNGLLQRCPFSGKAPSSAQCQWGGAYTHDWGAKEGGDWGRKSSRASIPSGVWVPITLLPPSPPPPRALPSHKSACYQTAGEYRSLWSAPWTHALTPLHLLQGSPHFCTSLWGGLGGTTNPSKPLFSGSSEAVILHFSFFSFQEAVRECMMKQK